MSSVIEPVELEPYPAYRESGLPCIGEVPEHWEVRRFGVLAAGFRNGLTAPQLESGVTAHLVSRIETISKGIVDYAKVGYLTGEEDHSPYLLRTDDFLISHINSYAKVGNSARYGGERPLIHGMNLIRVTPLKSVAPAFLGYMLKSELFRGAMQRACKPAINQVSVTTTAIKAIYFPFPPFHEQAAIVRYLDDADQRIRAYVRAKKGLIALLEEQRQAIIHQAVTRGLDPDVKLKPSGLEWLGDAPEHWAVRRLKQVSTIQAGLTLGKAYRNAELIERPYLRVANVQSGHLDLSEITTVQVPLAEVKKTTLEIGDVLMTEGGDIDKLGRGCMWQGEIPCCLHQNHVFAVRPNPTDLNPAFLVALMGTVQGRNYFHATAKQTTNLAATNRTTLGEFPIYLPSIREQQAIVDHITKESSARDAAINRARRQIELVEEYRTRLIADAVTGQIDVRGARP